MNRELVRTATLFIALLALQVAVLDNIKIGGYITPYLYVLFLMLFPFSYGSFSFMMTAFFLGLAVDTFEFSGGLHAMACVAVAFVRRWSVTTFLGIPRKEIYAYRPLDGKNLGTASVLLFFALVFLHHYVLYFFEAMSLSAVFSAAWNAFLNALVTFVVSVIAVFFIKGRSARM